MAAKLARSRKWKEVPCNASSDALPTAFDGTELARSIQRGQCTFSKRRQKGRFFQGIDMSKAFTLNLTEIRKRAREKIREGARTAAYGHDRDEVIRILNTVLATEIVCTMRYRNNALVAQGIHAETAAAEFLEHAAEEESHANSVAKRIIQLGGVPDMNPATLTERSHADYFTSTNVQELIRENLIAERIAIETYSELVRWLGEKDPTTRRLIEELLAKEEEHAEDLATLISH
ncbi:MAG: hypothetical protein RL385_2498 [Pseudomonadota bacterium]|jgi:bacterioferritin